MYYRERIAANNVAHGELLCNSSSMSSKMEVQSQSLLDFVNGIISISALL